MPERKLIVMNLGRCDYDAAWSVQRETHARLAADPAAPDVLILVEHPPVITLGRRANRTNLLLSPAELDKHGILLREVDRGGDITYHGPGQLVAYPIIRLLGPRRDVHRYFHSLEETVISVLADYAIEGGRQTGLTGVWVADSKICAMGVAIKRWITYHGLALNVNTDLTHFRFITPCGIAGKGVTSLQRLLGHAVAMAEVSAKLVCHFAKEFDLDPQ